jgi:hypothetical protein
MSTAESADSKLGAQLYQSLPEVYRTRDESGDLRLYLDACGGLLDRIRETIEQRLADAFPDHPECQPWVLPYLARLLDVKLASPVESEWREELARAVALRQRKGTLAALEELVQVLGRFEWDADDPTYLPGVFSFLQEGWKRVAVTPRVGEPLLTAEQVRARPLPEGEAASRYPSRMARHPALPAVTVDFRYPSHKVRLASGPEGLVQQNPHGVPVAPGRYDDVSRRTVDLRPLTVRQGHAHPQRVLLFALPRVGFFLPGWWKGDTSEKEEPADAPRKRRRPGSLPSYDLTGTEDNPIHLIKGLVLPHGQNLKVSKGTLVLENCVIDGNLELASGDRVHRLEDSIVSGAVVLRSGRVEIRRSAITWLGTYAWNETVPDADVRDSLLGTVDAGHRVRFIGSTVLGTLKAGRCQASDSIFVGEVTLTGTRPATSPGAGERFHCFRYSRLPPEPLKTALAHQEAYQCVSDKPLFFSSELGKVMCGVLRPESPASLLEGAEDGGEMGAYHHLRHVLRDQAVLARVREFLPAGMDAVFTHDDRIK